MKRRRPETFVPEVIPNPLPQGVCGHLHLPLLLMSAAALVAARQTGIHSFRVHGSFACSAAGNHYNKLDCRIEVLEDLSTRAFFDRIANAVGLPCDITAANIGVQSLEEDQPFCLRLWIRRHGKGFGLRASCSTKELSDRITCYLRTALRSLLRAWLRNTNVPVGSLRILPGRERRQVLVEWNRTARPYPKNLSVPDLFRQRASQFPDKVAVTWRSQHVSYAAMDRLTDRFAQHLMSQGVGPGSTVAIFSRRSLDYVLAMLSVAKAGAAYVPLTPDVPPPILAQRLAQSKPVLLLHQAGLEAQLAGLCLPPMSPIESVQKKSAGRLMWQLPTVAADSQLYIMFTSGTQGTPKGVSICHRCVVNLAMHSDYAIQGRDDVVLQLAPLSFDASTFEVWAALLSGARLVIYPEEDLSLPVLEEILRKESVTVLWLTSALFAVIVRRAGYILRPARCVLTGGDIVSPSAAASFLENNPDSVLINGYGPTECTTFTCYHRITLKDVENNSLPIGKPIANARVYILNSYLELQGPGAMGELCIAGDGLALEYLNAPDQTAERFTTVNFGKGRNERIYRTGDRARFRYDGVIEFFGRMDRQVKIRGHRVELAEIEAALLFHSAIEQAHVNAEGDSAEERRIIAYYVPKPDHNVQPEAIRSFLKTRLPEPSLPSFFIELSILPLTPSGKVDHRSLPFRPRLDGSPKTWTDERLLQIWREILRQPFINMLDSFFDAGGNSLLALQLLSEIEKCFGVVLPMSTLYEHQNISGMAALLTTSGYAWKDLIRISEGKNCRPLFCVHGLSGDPFNLFPLSHYLRVDCPIYALQARPDSQPDISIQEMASRYLKCIREVQPEGPYLLCGYSAGGIVAFEMALQLEALGERSRLVMLDTEAPDRIQHGVGEAAAPIETSGDIMQRDGLREAAAEVVPLSGYAQRRLSFMVSFFQALLTYTPSTSYPGMLILIHTRSVDVPSGWQKYVRTMATAEVNGDHFNFLKEPAIREVAQSLQKFIDMPDRS